MSYCEKRITEILPHIDFAKLAQLCDLSKYDMSIVERKIEAYEARRERARAYGRLYIKCPNVKIRRKAYEQSEKVKAYRRAYQQRPERKAIDAIRNKVYRERPEVKERLQEYRKIREQTEQVKAYRKEYKARPEVKQRNRERQQTAEYKERRKEYHKRPEVKERLAAFHKEWSQRPEVKAHLAAYARERYARKKLERQGVINNGK